MIALQRVASMSTAERCRLNCALVASGVLQGGTIPTAEIHDDAGAVAKGAAGLLAPVLRAALESVVSRGVRRLPADSGGCRI